MEVLGTMRSVNIARLKVSPINYNPKTGIIKVYNNIKVELSFVNGNPTKTMDVKKSTYSPYFTSTYKKILNNKTVIDEHPNLTKYPVKMLILADRMFETALAPYILWKTKKGFNVIVSYTDEQYNGQDLSSVDVIKAWVQGHYDAGTSESPAPSFCLFVGDTPQIPASQIGDDSGRGTDLYYFSQDGDYFPEMYYGRFSANNVTELQPIIDKTIYHETYSFDDPTYLDDATLIAGADGFGWNPKVGQPTVIYGTDNYFNTSHGFTTVNSYLDSYEGCYDNDKISVYFINYTAHCDETSWATPNLSLSDVQVLTNTNKYPLAVGNCCMSADFASTVYPECIGEAWIRGEDKGAVAYIGSSPSSYWWEDFYWAVGAFDVPDAGGVVPSTSETTLGVYDAMFISDYVSVDASVFLGNLVVTEAYAQDYNNSGGSGCSPLYYWEAYNCLGDPSLVTFRTQGENNIESHLSTLPIGTTSYSVDAEPGSYVAISKDGVLHGAALVDATGSVNVPIIPVTSGGDVDIVVTKPQYIPYIVAVPAASLNGPYLVVDSYNNEINYGQSINLDIVLKNVGSENASNVSVAVSTTDVNASITNMSLTYGNISAGATASASSGEFILTVVNNITDQYIIPVNIAITDGSKTLWEQTKNIIVNAPALEVAFDTINDNSNDLSFVSNPLTIIDENTSYSYDIQLTGNMGNANGFLDPGETVAITVNTGNNGHASLLAAKCTLTSTDPHVTVNSGVHNLGLVEVGASVPAVFNITIDDTTPIGSTVELIVTFLGGEYSETITLNLPVGLQIENFESGDFSSYAWINTNMEIQTSDVYEGTYAAHSTTAGQSDSEAKFELQLNVTSDGTISFYKKISCESGDNYDWDYLEFLIDNTRQEKWTGELDWSKSEFDITAGTHILTWKYVKDGSVNGGEDCAWVDYIILPGHTSAKETNTISISAPILPTWLTLTDNGDGTANLSGTSPSEAGVYDVVLSAVGAGSPAEQGFKIVVGSYVSVESINKEIEIYPNPNNGIFTINLSSLKGENAKVEVVSVGGQTVYLKETTTDKLRIDLNNQAKGIYFVKIASDKGLVNYKIILQ